MEKNEKENENENENENDNENDNENENEKENENENDLMCSMVKEDFIQYDLCFKIIVIGDVAVGKTCLTLKATKNFFESNYTQTVGFEFYSFNCIVDKQNIKLQIWDTCGQEEYRALIQNFYRNASLAILVYAIDSKESFTNLEMWLNEIKTKGNPEVKIFLIGNKSDLEDKRKVSHEEGEQFFKDNQLDLFLETSAKTGFNAQEVFLRAAKILYAEHMKYRNRSSRPDSIIRLTPSLIQRDEYIIDDGEEKKQNKQGCCCKG